MSETSASDLRQTAQARPDVTRVSTGGVAGKRRPATGRDQRLDFFRGLALMLIFVDHIPNNVLTYFTLRTWAFNDAAEVFIFISGYTAALVYGKAVDAGHFGLAVAQICRRIWKLYVTHVFLFVIFMAEVSYSIIHFSNAMYGEELGIGNFLQEPHVAIIRMLLLSFQPTYLDILPLYIVLLALLPAILLALWVHPLLAFAPSLALYVLARLLGWEIHTYPNDQPWYFNPFAWQLLFTTGAMFGFARLTGNRILDRLEPVLTRVALIFVAFGVIINISWTLHGLLDSFPALGLRLLWPVDKSNLAIVRFLNFLALAHLASRFIPRQAQFFSRYPARFAVLCGRQSLEVFCLGILLATLSRFILTDVWTGIVAQLVLSVAGLAIMIACAACLRWYRRASGGGARPSDDAAASIEAKAATPA